MVKRQQASAKPLHTVLGSLGCHVGAIVALYPLRAALFATLAAGTMTAAV
jgi:hypothetical protein